MGLKEDAMTVEARKKGEATNRKYPDNASKSAAQDAANNAAYAAYEARKKAGMKSGGTVKKYAGGGSVCRGAGAATRGVKFKGVM